MSSLLLIYTRADWGLLMIAAVYYESVCLEQMKNDSTQPHLTLSTKLNAATPEICFLLPELWFVSFPQKTTWPKLYPNLDAIVYTNNSRQADQKVDV